MADFDLSAIMDAIAVRAGAALPTGTRMYAYPAADIAVPALVVAYPEDQIDFDITYGDGLNHAVFPVYVAVGQANDKAARDAISKYISSDGQRAIKAALDGTLGGVVQSAAVEGCTIAQLAIGALEYLAARFDLDVYV
jgi:hypothetical protein